MLRCVARAMQMSKRAITTISFDSAGSVPFPSAVRRGTGVWRDLSHSLGVWTIVDIMAPSRSNFSNLESTILGRNQGKIIRRRRLLYLWT